MEIIPDPVRSMILRVYEIAGRVLRVEADEQWIIEKLDKFLTALRAVPKNCDQAPPANAVLQISIRHNQAIPANDPGTIIAEGVKYYCGPDGCHVRLHDSLIFAGGTNATEVWTVPQLIDNGAALSAVFAYSVMTALRRAGAFELHSAAVIEPRSETAVLLVGISGSGKSTLSLHLAAKGWDYSTDDVLLLTSGQKVIEAHGIRQVFAITSETLVNSGLIELDYLAKSTGSESMKRTFLPESVFTSKFVSKCQPSVLFFPCRANGEKSEVKPLSPSEAMRRLLAMCLWASFDGFIATAYLRVLEGLVRQCRSFELLTGKDLLSNPDYTASFLADAIGN